MSSIEHEIEVKILVSTADMQQVFDALSSDAEDGEIKTKHRPRAYFDTKKRAISDARMALRVQYKENIGRYEQTLKYEDTSDQGTAMSRIEVKNILGKKHNHPDLSRIDLSAIKDKQVRRLIKDLKSTKLEHVFTASVKRKYFVVSVVEAGVEIGKVELAFDAGKVAHATEQDLCENISEIEVELKSGDATAVDIMCKRILDMVPEASISSVSKAETGYRLDDQAQERKKKSKNVGENLASECKDLPKKSRRMLPPK